MGFRSIIIAGILRWRHQSILSLSVSRPLVYTEAAKSGREMRKKLAHCDCH
jgi:hypothetical protein